MSVTGEDDEVQEDLGFSLMIPGATVFMRYGTRQHNSSAGEDWREVMVYKHGLVGDTDLGYGDADGWWCVHDNVLKFFLRRRIREVMRVYDYEANAASA